jgi:predicted RNA-binding protein with PIN domain
VTFLIDGYNLMHAVGLLGRTRRGNLDRARTRLLDWLADTAAGRSDVLRVVFDARTATSNSPEQDHRGVRVVFATGRTADELIEELVSEERHPGRLTVVSNDAQVQEAGRRRGCGVRACEEFVDWLIEDRRGATPTSDPEKPGPQATADEMSAWLAAFSTPKRRGR